MSDLNIQAPLALSLSKGEALNLKQSRITKLEASWFDKLTTNGTLLFSLSFRDR
jgi:hypothetical protein